MRPRDIELLTVPSSPALHDELLLISSASPDLRSNRYLGGLHRIEPTGPPGTRRWTHGDRDSAPVISPDGRWVAFLRTTGRTGYRAKPQLCVMPSDGGEPRRLTELPLGVETPAWAPDSRHIAFTARIPEPGRYGSPDEDGAVYEADEEAPRRIDRLDYRLDDVGFVHDRPACLFVVDALESEQRAAEPVALTGADASVESPVWTPDGGHIVVVAGRGWGRPDSINTDLYAVPACGGEPVLVVRTSGAAMKPAMTPDGVLLYLGIEFPGTEAMARNTGLWATVEPVSGALGAGAEPVGVRRLTDPESVDCEVPVGAPVVHGNEVLVAVLNRGAVELRSVPLDAWHAPLHELGLVAGDRAQVNGFTAHGDRVVAIVSTVESFGEVVLVEGGQQRVLTDFAGALRAAGRTRAAEELSGASADGYPVHGWLMLPDGPGPHPVLLIVHGGPYRYYGWGFLDEAQVYANAGYAVVMPNPRGSAGYGQRHGRTIIGRYGGVDADDVLAVLDLALSRPECDAGRVGVMGGSYGGYLTGWLAAHHGERFRAAWSERALNAADSFLGCSDIGWWFTDGYLSTDPEQQRMMSPLSYASKIDIPFVIVHSEQDWRCPIEQAQRMFVELRRNGVDAEMLIFPGEGHELSRSGQPRHRLQRFEAALDWWSRHLGSPGGPATRVERDQASSV